MKKIKRRESRGYRDKRKGKEEKIFQIFTSCLCLLFVSEDDRNREVQLGN